MTSSQPVINVTTRVEARELIIERVFNAPRETVFKMYSESEHLQRWWGPKGWRTSTLRLDFREGGMWHFCMTSPDGKMKPCAKFEYKEIVAPERIAYIESFVDAKGNTVGDLPERIVTVTFESYGQQTKLVMITEFSSIESLQTIVDMGMIQGFTENFSRLEEYLAKFNSSQVREDRI